MIAPENSRISHYLHRGVIRSNLHYFGISLVCLSILILSKITQPRLCGPIRAQHTDEVA